MSRATATPYKDKPGILVKVEPDLYEMARRKAAMGGSTITAVLRALLDAWVAAPPISPLTGMQIPEGLARRRPEVQR
jgi:hypothetical protein